MNVSGARPAKTKILYVLGTDTGVGKTVVAALLTRVLHEHFDTVLPFKPVSSGARHDARQLREACERAVTLDQINPFHFKRPIAPSLAARYERRIVKLSAVVRRLDNLATRAECVVVEGAGGVLTPLGERWNVIDLMTARPGWAILVSGNWLGTLNHTLLAMDRLKTVPSRGIVVLLNDGVRRLRTDASRKDNQNALRECLACPLLTLPKQRKGARLSKRLVDEWLDALRQTASGNLMGEM